eukprot:COSAG01_NODE_1177_length_11372_cov_4.507851_1_plen_65_part_00
MPGGGFCVPAVRPLHGATEYLVDLHGTDGATSFHVAAALKAHAISLVVVDPVMVASSNAILHPM